ncbi:hypothetical protein [Nonomuraea dietziae]|uniref:Site-specific recombinase XerC n=1 Tax=Nonomuraea dietziae TaxID=65515 RepID=A0A7W5V6I7_9ACTN|nr:hypothetical protein [Nonomuraea dietziae]MBB3730049.1 site-specific recombinase XerC [Nonomuraea dietziae]
MRVSQLTLDSTNRPKAEHWIIPRLGAHRLDRLRPEHLDAFYAGLTKEGLAPNTILQIHRILSRALKLAVRRELITRNVCQMIDAPTGEDNEIEPLLREEAQAILDVVKGHRNGNTVVRGARPRPSAIGVARHSVEVRGPEQKA